MKNIKVEYGSLEEETNKCMICGKATDDLMINGDFFCCECWDKTIGKTEKKQ